MPGGDSRKDFLLATTANFFSLSVSDDAVSGLHNGKEINNFLDNASCFLLSIKGERREKRLILHALNKVESADPDENVLVFFKIKPDVITPSNLHSNVIISSMLDSPINSLYQSLQKVFTPILLQDEKWSRTFDPRLQTLLNDLETGLGSLLRIQTKSSGDSKTGHAQLTGILTPIDEYKYWTDLIKTSRHSDEKEQAKSFSEILEPIYTSFSSLDAINLESCDDLLETTYNSLDELWKQDENGYYPQIRMAHLMEIIGNAIGRAIQDKLTSHDIWNGPYVTIEQALSDALNVCEMWNDYCKELTTLYWPGYTPHPWRGPPFLPTQLGKLTERLQKVLSLRNIHNHLLRLLSERERNDFKMSDAFKPFSGLNPIHYNPYTEPLWTAAVTQFENALGSAEKAVTNKLKARLHNIRNNPLQLMYEFKKYQELMLRPKIKKDLIGERELLLSELADYVSKMQKEIKSTPRKLPNVPDVVNGIMWLKQLESKMINVEKTSDLLLSDLSKYKTLKKNITETLEEMRENLKDSFNSWIKEISSGIDNQSLSLATSNQVLEFGRDKKMRVNYNPRLVTLVREVRQLTVLGYAIQPKIQQAADRAKEFSCQAKDLQQIANFHNTVIEQMILSQRSMMLESAVRLEKLVEEQHGITWNNSDILAKYISKLQDAAESLSRENHQLRSYHFNVCEKVCKLMATPLLRQQHKWKEFLTEIREVMVNVEKKGFPADHMKPWKAHWDRQLYKALEHQYQMELETLNEHLPEINVELTYRQQKLQFYPPLEEIRTKYYSQLKRLLSIPIHFKGVHNEVAGDNLIFPVMVERNAHRFGKVYKKAEGLFARLDELIDKFRPWVVLGTFNLDELADKHLHAPDDWETNFRALKLKSQEAGKLPSGQEKIGCISVSFAPVKAIIDDHIQKLWDTLLGSLRRSIAFDMAAVESFAKNAIAHLSHRPQTADDISNAYCQHTALNDRKSEISNIISNSEAKNKLLGTWAREKVDNLSKLQGLWETFEQMMKGFEQNISQEVETLRVNKDGDVHNYTQKLQRYSEFWKKTRPNDNLISVNKEELMSIISDLKDKRTEFEVLKKEEDLLLSDSTKLGMDVPNFTISKQIEEDLMTLEQKWFPLAEFYTGQEEMGKELWKAFRGKTYRYEEYLNQWAEKLKNDGPPFLIQQIDACKAAVPLLKYCRGDIFMREHWQEMFQILSIPTHKSEDELIFQDILDVKEAIILNSKSLKDLNGRAQGQVTIRQALQELDTWGAISTFSLTASQDSKGTSIKLIKDWKDLLNKIGDNQCLLQSLKDTPYYNNFKDRVSLWETRLADLDEYLHNFNQIQRKWLYLEPIFGRGALPKEQARFSKVDDDFKSIMRDIEKDNRVLVLISISGLRKTLINLLDQLQRCQKSLNEFLEEKRSLFPRFYFIGDDDLLEILGQSTNPTVIQSHLRKLFAGIHMVSFDSGNKFITTMHSLEGEVVPLKNKVQITLNVEEWLGKLAEEMKDTLKGLLQLCVKDSMSGQGADPLKYPSQILCLAEQISFTYRCETAIRTGNLKQLYAQTQKQLQFFTETDLGTGNTKDQTRVLDLKLKSLILDVIHSMDVVDQLIKTKINQIDDWVWQKQLRFYLREDGIAMMRMVDAEFDYTYEYQGNAPKLVHTPLTDKCYLTLTQGMRMGLGGNPYGPAGTGKTESVKALGNLFGRQVLVFNCDEGIDVKSMGRIFIGIVKCGAWGCFDEFNRLEEAVLSAVSMQIQAIQAALKNKDKTIDLLDRKVPVDFNSGIFITMNPAGKGYGGRQKLPDNLKQLFRPVAMSKPDNELIAEVILYSEGFKHAKQLGGKLVAMFNLSKELLTPQQHYDWGLRALKTVLKGCGNLLQHSRKKLLDESPGKTSDESEKEIVVQALRMNTLSKLTFSDSQRFDALIHDVFSKVEFSEGGYEDLTSCAREVCEDMGLIMNDGQMKKILELNEQLQQRMGVVIVGPSGSGKSTLWRVLFQALQKSGRAVKFYTVNPKAMPRTQLLGHIDMDTREWTDGVLTNNARLVVKEPQDVTSWIICDGDIDPEWIESLNSVLDDNRLLTMPSGERIQFGPNVNFIFETHDLSCASPATISRMGMIFLSDEETDVKALISLWLQKQDDSIQKQLSTFLDDYFYKALDFVQNQKAFVVETSLVGTVMNGLSHLHNVRSKAHFAVALIRGLGGNLTEHGRLNFAKEVFSWTDESAPDAINPLNTFYNSDRDRLESYQNKSENALDLNDFSQGSPPLVLTSDVQRYLDGFMSWFDSESRQPFLLVGPEGCGKNLLLQHCFANLRSTQVAVIHCSAQTSPQNVIQKLSQMCIVISSNTGRVYRPKDSERLILYLRDLNLPKPDKWGTSQLIAFLQQAITYNGFYDQNVEWVGLEGIQVVSSMTSGNAVGKHNLSTRFTSIVRICSISYPVKEQLQSIYTAYMVPVLHEITGKNSRWNASSEKASKLATTMIEIYEQTKKCFTTDDYHHYSFTPRDLSRWVMGFLRYNLKESNEDEVQAMLQITVYEAKRLFQDKLVGEESHNVKTCIDSVGAVKSQLEDILRAAVEKEWNINVMESLKNTYFVTKGAKTDTVITPGAQLPSFGLPLGKLDSKEWEKIVKELNIFIFHEVLNNIARIDHALSKPAGSLLLAGVSGVGRRTAVTVVAHMHRYTLFTPSIARGYGLKQFTADLKTVCQLAGVEGQQVVLLLEDHQLLESAFLEMINSLLSAGEVPGLYTPEETEPLLGPLREQASQENFNGPLFSYFATRVQKNLHIVLIMDFSNPNFSLNCESNPAFYKKCSIQWLDGWCKESMLKIPELILSGGLATDNPDGEPEKSISKKRRFSGPTDFANYFVQIHDTISKNISTPRRFVMFLKTYIAVYNRKKKGISERQKHLQAGVSKLNEAKEIVDKLKSQADQQTTQLADKRSEADKALQLITNSMQSAGDQKIEMESLREQTMKEGEKLAKRKKEIDEELKEIDPLIQEAKAAVGGIKSESLSEIRSMRAPPNVIRDILEAVLRLMGIFDTSWNNMKSFLAKRGVKEEITSFDAHRITHEIAKSVLELVSDPEKKKSFDPINAKRAKLRDKLNKSTKEAAEIEINLRKAEETITAAESLVGKLDSEYERWTVQVIDLGTELEKLPMQALLASAFITYLSLTSEDARHEYLAKWLEALQILNFDVRKFLSSEREQLTWRNEGLPSDELSMENAVVILQSALRPLLIDPSSVATEWLKKHLQSGKLEIINQQDTNFIRTLELAVRFGKTLLIQEVETIEPVLIPLLRGDLISQGPRYVIQLGDKTIDYNEEFKLFLTTRNAQPEIPSDAASIITLVNFTTTRTGLKGQLLGLTLQYEKPELEVRLTDLLRKEEELKIQLMQLEDSLLEQLANATGNILENKDLLSSLNKTKSSSSTITQALEESRSLQKSLQIEKDAYSSLAEFGSKLYFVIRDVSKLNHMYRFSLASFLSLFQQALQYEQVSQAETEVRLRQLQNILLNFVFRYLSRSLFKADQLAFTLHLIHGMQSDLFQTNEWEAFTGIFVSDLKIRPNDMIDTLPSWIDEERALSISLLKNIFPDFYSGLQLHDSELWRPFANSSQCELEIPAAVSRKITPFQQILLIQSLRPDRLQSCIVNFASSSLGIKELSPPPLNLKKLYGETTSMEPILILTSSGADPSHELQELANQIVGPKNYHQVAMGQGQSEAAVQLLHQCSTAGDWLCLKNLHLVTSWLPALEKILKSLDSHKNFRLWLTAEAHPKFTPILLQISLKVTYESPSGVKKNLLRTYDAWTPEFVAQKGNVISSRALFALAWFNTVIQERRNFIPQGWTKFYEFGLSDLRAGADIIERMCSNEEFQWESIRGLYEEAIYGGRIDNIFDLRVMSSYLNEFFNSSVLNKSRVSFGPGISLPTSTNYQDFIQLIDRLPEEDNPTSFGLAANIQRSAQRNVANKVISQLRIIMRSSEAASKFDREQWKTQLSPILNLWKKLNESSQIAKKELPQIINTSAKDIPVESFVRLEHYTSIKLVEYIHRSLALLSKVIRGHILLTPDIKVLATALLQQETPQTWQRQWEGPEDPFQYIHGLMSRAIAIEKWVKKMETGSLLKEVLDLADLFRPDTFLNALRQQTAREMNTRMDKLTFKCSWKGNIPNSKLSLKIGGLLLEGCLFDGSVLSEVQVNSPTVSSIPPCTVAWVSKESVNSSLDEVISLPVYFTRDREKIVTHLDVPCTSDVKWVQFGAALFLKIN
uniref:Cytoplasmic dynein 2 heavy chain 1 n=1 Tax=Strigamia maritima TaxID=126957 RepID=T1IHY1_STRMM